jgi:hypothetical protein
MYDWKGTMEVAKITRNRRFRPGNLYLANTNPANEDVSRMLTVETVEIKVLLRKNLANGTAVNAST